jgi:flagellar basal body-associated protein FliL
MIWFRVFMIAALIVVMVWAWWFGERIVNRYLPETTDDYQHRHRQLACLFVGLWRLLMICVATFAVVSVAGLWSAQDAGEKGEEAGEKAEAAAYEVALVTVELCENTRNWQEQALSIREADKRIANAEVADARAEVADAEIAITAAKQSGEYANAFVGPYLDRDLRRAQEHLVALLGEAQRRAVDYDTLEQLKLTECPPAPEDS